MTTPPHDPLDPVVGSTTPADPYSTGQYDTSTTSSTSSTTDAAKDEAKNVKDAAAGATQQVASTAKEQAGHVVSDVREQTRQLAGQTKTQLSGQVSEQRNKAVGGIRSLADELRSMAEQGGQSGPVTQLAHEGAHITQQVADFIEQREPAELIDEVRSFARQKPGTFLVGAAVAGVVMGRLTRGAVAARQDDSSSSGSYPSGSYPTGYAQVAPSAYPGAVTDTTVGTGYGDVAPGYGTQQMDQLAYPAEGSQYATDATYTTDTGTYAGEEPGLYDDVTGDHSTTTNPSDQGYRP